MNVSHNLPLTRFEITVDDATALLDYTRTGGLMVITHTVVPPELRGQSIAGRLAKAAFAFAQAEALKVVPQCSYIGVYAKRYPEVQPLLVNGSADSS